MNMIWSSLFFNATLPRLQHKPYSKSVTTNNMTQNMKYLLVGILFVFYSCKNTPNDNQTVIVNNAVDTSASTASDALINGSAPEYDTSITIVFNEITIRLSRLIEFNEETSTKTIAGDSCYITSDIGETIFGKQIEVLSTTLEDLKIEQCFETSISISNEGPHCDLLNWKHYYSNWTTLKKISTNAYQCESFPENKDLKFPDVDMKEFLQIVAEHCGEPYAEKVRNNKQITPENIGISKVFIRLTGKYNKRVITKQIIIELALGC